MPLLLSRYVSSHIREKYRINTNTQPSDTNLIHPTVEKSFLSRDLLTSTLKLNSREASISSESNFQSNTLAITAVICLSGYTSFVQSLGDRGDIPPHIIARGVESTIVMCVDIITAYGGDVRFEGDKIVCYWRVKNEDQVVGDVCIWRRPGDNDGTKGLDGQRKREISDLCCLVVLCCGLVKNTLDSTQMYALEDLDEKFKGFKFDCGISIGMGWIEEFEIGINYYVMAHVVLADTAIMTDDGVWCSKEVWAKTKGGLDGFGIQDNENNQNYLKLQWKSVGVDEMQRLYTNLKQIIECPDDDTLAGYTSPKLETYVWDLTINLIMMIRKEKNVVYYPGAWKDTVALSLVVENSDLQTSQAEKINEYQTAFETILKAAKQFNMELYLVTALGIGYEKFLVQLVSVKKNEMVESNNQHIAAISLALSTFEALTAKGTHCAIALMSGLSYEGLLKTVSRSQYRLIGESLTVSAKIASETTKSGIFVDQRTFDNLRDSPLVGMLHKIVEGEEDLLYLNGFYKISRRKDRVKRSASNTPFTGAFAGPYSQLENFVIKLRKKKISGTVKINGLQGSGKTTFLGQAESLLSKMGSAECPENEAFAQPLFPFVSILHQMLFELESINSSMGLVRDLSMEIRERAFSSTPYPRKSKLRIVTEGLYKPGAVKTALSPELKMDSDLSQKKLKSPGHSPNNSVVRHSALRKSILSLTHKVKPKKSKVTMWEKYRAKIFSLNSRKVHPTGPEANPGFNSEMLTYFENDGMQILRRLRELLKQADEDLAIYLPLLNPIIQADVPDTPESAKIGADGRILLLSGLFVRMLDKISEKKPCAIIIDDFHHVDSASFSIFLNIIRRCKNVLFVFSSASTKGWRARAGPLTEETGLHLRLSLDESSANVVREILTAQFEIWASEIDDAIVDLVKRQSAGKTAHIPIVSAYLKESKLLTVIDDKLCVGPNNKKDLENLIGTDFGQILLTEFFDRIPTKEFKAFLKRASVVGRYFSLEEVCATMMHDQNTPQDALISRIRGMIKLFDVYGMIVERDVGKKKAHNYPFQLDYMFVHSELRDSIYKERLTDGEKKSIHLKLLVFYEKNITFDNEPTFLPLVCYHGRFAGFADRDSVIQHLQYCVLLGKFLCLSCEAFKETITIYTYCKQLIDYNFLEEIIGKNVISEMHTRLSHAYSHGLLGEINRAQSVQHLKTAMSVMGFVWPSSTLEWQQLCTTQMAFWAMTNWVRPLLGKIFRQQQTVRLSKWRKYLAEVLGNDDFSRNSYLERLEHLQPIFEAMSRNLSETESPMIEQAGCDLLVLNNSFRIGNYNSYSVRLLMALAIKAWYLGYRGISRSFADRCNLKNIEPQGLANGSFFWITTGNWKVAKEWIEKGITLSTRLGEFLSWLAITKELSFLQIWKGDFKNAIALENDRLFKSKMNRTPFGIASAEVSLSAVEVLTGNISNAKNRKDSIEKRLHLAPYYVKAQYLAVQSHLEISDGNFQNGLDCIENLLGLLDKIRCEDTVFITIFLSILALRSVGEMAKKESSKFSKRKTSTLSALTGAFQSVKIRSPSFTSTENGKRSYKSSPLGKLITRSPSTTSSSPETSIKLGLPPLPEKHEAARKFDSPPVSFRNSRMEPAQTIAEDVEVDIRRKPSKLANILGLNSAHSRLSERDKSLNSSTQDMHGDHHSLTSPLEARRGKNSIVLKDDENFFPKPKLDEDLEPSNTQEFASPLMTEQSVFISLNSEELDIACQSPITGSFNYPLPGEIPAKKGPNRRLSSLVGFRSSIAASDKSQANQDYTFRLKFLNKQLTEKLTIFQRHVCAEPLLLILKAHLRSSLEHGAAETTMMMSAGPEALRNWTRKLSKSYEEDMKLVLSLALLSCGNSPKYSKEFEKGKLLAEQMGFAALLQSKSEDSK